MSIYDAKEKILFIIAFVFLPRVRSACLIGLEAIYRDGIPVGYVRRSDYGFFLDKPVAYGLDK
jgi:hypothetical protein